MINFMSFSSYCKKNLGSWTKNKSCVYSYVSLAVWVHSEQFGMCVAALKFEFTNSNKTKWCKCCSVSWTAYYNALWLNPLALRGEVKQKSSRRGLNKTEIFQKLIWKMSNWKFESKSCAEKWWMSFEIITFWSKEMITRGNEQLLFLKQRND